MENINFNAAKIDSLKAEMKKAKTKEQKISIYHEIYEQSKEQIKAQEQADIEQKELLRILFKKDNKGMSDGFRIYNKLVGYTSAKEQAEIKDIIKNQTPQTIYGFLNRYEFLSYDLGGDHFFKQMKREYNFDEKQVLMRSVATDLKELLSNSGLKLYEDMGKRINQILKNKNLSDENAAELDKIVQNIIFNDENSSSANGFLPDSTK